MTSIQDSLQVLGFSEKEVKVYLALLEFGTQTASVIAKRTNLPRPTVLFLFSHLVERNFIRKTKRGSTQYFHADPQYLNQAKRLELQRQMDVLDQSIPLLEEFKSPFSAPPKVQFFEGLESCKMAYSQLLDSQTPILEFAAHHILERMGADFMRDFIEKRVENGVSMRAICQDTLLHRDFQSKDILQKRELRLFDAECGELFSSIAVYENKVLLLNLCQDAFAILIESAEFSKSMETLHRILFDKLEE